MRCCSNCPEEDADRYIELDALDKFASELAKSGHVGLARRLYYDEDTPELYSCQPSTEEQREGDLFFVHKGGWPAGTT